MAAGDAKWDSEELALLALFISEGHSLARGLSSGPVAAQLCPPREGGVRGASYYWTVTAISQSLGTADRGGSLSDTEAITPFVMVQAEQVCCCLSCFRHGNRI